MNENLKQWIESLTDDSPIKIAYLAKQYVECANICLNKNQPGYIPARHIVASIGGLGWPKIDEVYKYKYGAVPNELWLVCSKAVLIKDSLLWEVPLRTPVSEAIAAGQGLISGGLITQDNLNAVLAGEVKLSIIETVFGYDKSITAAQLEELR